MSFSFHKQTTLPDLTTSATIPLPQTIGPYKIEGFLNKGGMSFLYLGIHPQTKDLIAIKVLSPAYISHPDAMEHFLNEAKAIEMSQHPNIVKWYGHGKWEQGLYIAMEFVRGVSLKQFITQHSFSRKRALEVILQVAYALLHLHGLNIVHRDVKPENILINEEGEVKVIDFGIVQLHNGKKRNKKSSSLLGTLNYMSPEQKEDSTKVTPASDIYSLGVILYEMILGKLSHGLIELSLLPQHLRAIAAKALAVSPSERYTTISAFIHDLSHYLTSGELERERPGSDQLKEIFEAISKANKSLSPSQLPSWPSVDLGFSKASGSDQLGLYSDFFTLANGSHLILLAPAYTSPIEALVGAAHARGMIRMLLRAKTPLEPRAFIEQINQELTADTIQIPLAFLMLILDPTQDKLTYFSAGCDSLLHIPEGESVPRRLSSPNPFLGIDSAASFSEVNDNWNVGDQLILHTLTLPEHTPQPMREQFEESFDTGVQETLLFSAQRQADTLLQKLVVQPSIAYVPFAKALICIQRIA